MIRLLSILALLITILSCSSVFEKHAGTSTDVSNGSISGIIAISGLELSRDTFNVNLIDITQRTRSSLMLSLVVTDGIYQFDSLSDGIYQVMIFHNELQVAQKDSIPITTEYPDVKVDFTVGASKQVVSGDFENGVDSWSLVKTNSGQGVFETENGELHITVQNQGTAYEDVSVRKEISTLEKGAIYELAFDAHAVTPRYIQVGIKQTTMPYNWFGWCGANGEVRIDSEKRRYRSSFQIISTDNGDSELMFNCGGYLNSDIYIDNVSLKRIADAEEIVVDPTKALPGENMIKDNTESTNEQYWFYDNRMSVQFINGEYTIHVPTVEGQPWDMQFFQKDLYLVEGYEYSLSFDAYATEERDIRLAISGSSFPWPYYAWFGKDSHIAITNEKTSYQLDFTMDNITDENGQITFYCGSHLSDLFIGNVVLVLKKK